MAACVCPAISEARERLQAEISRHDTVLRNLEREGEDDDDDEEFEAALLRLTGNEVDHSEENFYPSAALQLVEERIEEKSRLKTGYLRKASRHGKRTSWRFHRVELRRDLGAFWLNYVSADAKRLSDKHELTMLKEHHVRLLPNGNTACDKAAPIDLGSSSPACCDSPPRTVPSPASLEHTSFDKARRHSFSWTKKVSLRRTTEKQDSCLFSLNVADGHSSVWMASSPQERDEWIRAIANASEMSSQPDDHDASNLAQLSDPIENETANEQIGEFLAAIDRVSKISSRKEFIKALIPSGSVQIAGETFPSCSSRFCVPVRWVRRNYDGQYPIVTIPYTPRPNSSLHNKWKNLLSSPSSNKNQNSESPINSPSQERASNVVVVGNSQPFSQMRKDMRRDRVSIDGEIILAEDGEHREEKIAKVLASQIFCAAQRQDSCSSLSQAGALEHACAILIASTRTSSGGDAYACVQALCHPIADKIVICPLSTRASPLEFTVLQGTRASFPHSRNSSSTSLAEAGSKSRQSKSDSTTPTTFAGRLFATFIPNAHASGDRLAPSNMPSTTTTNTSQIDCDEDDTGDGQQQRQRTKPHVSIRAKATSVYRICTSNPQDLPTDTWGVVRAEWNQEFLVFGEPNTTSNFRTSEARVELTISHFAPWEMDDADSGGTY